MSDDRWVRPVTLHNRDVALVPLGLDHREDLSRAAGDERIWFYMSADLREPEALDRWIEAALAERDAGRAMPFALIDRADGVIVGSTRFLNIAVPHRRLEIGWTWLAPRTWGGRVNTAAKRLLLSHAFEALGAVRVEFRTDARNRRSRAAIVKLGAREEGTLRRHMIVRDGYVRDTVQFAITDEDWPSVRDRLDARLASSTATLAG